MEKVFYIAAMGWLITEIPPIKRISDVLFNSLFFVTKLLGELLQCASCLSFWIALVVLQDPFKAAFAYLLAAIYEGILNTLKIKLP